jgi:hypothetical protein
LPPIPTGKKCHSKLIDKSNEEICKKRNEQTCDPNWTGGLCYWNDPKKIYEGAICVNRDSVKDKLEYLNISLVDICHNRC